MMKALLLLIFTLSLSGCVEYKWVKPDASDQQEN